MDENRTLPPLVRGTVTGFLDFFVDEIRIFRNIYDLNENCDLVVQVQWWGEVLPIYLRPEIVQLPKNYKRLAGLKYYPFAKYEIKTKIDLFKSYLSICEVLELIVLETIQPLIIGSSFLNDLDDVINNKEKITLPLIDCLGEKIGEIMIHFKYSEAFPKKKSSEKVFKKLINKPSAIIQPQKPNFHFMNENIIFANVQNEKMSAPNVIEVETQSTNDYNIPKLNLNSCLTSPAKSIESFCDNSVTKSFPEVEFVTDPSKVLHFETKKKLSKLNTYSLLTKSQKNIQSTKKLSLSVKGKKNPKEVTKNSSVAIKGKSDNQNFKQPSHQFSSEIFVKHCDNSNGVFSRDVLGKEAGKVKEKSEIQNSENLPLKAFDSSKKNYQEIVNSILENEVTNKFSNKKVLNYLLGSEMSKEDEEDAINNFKKMSPSHNIVESICQLISESSSESFRAIKDNTVDQITDLDSDSVTVFGLHFNLNNAIERKYYEKFFQQSFPSHDFEIAKFLNQPKSISETLSFSNDSEPEFIEAKKLHKNSEIYKKIKEKILNPINDLEPFVQEPKNTDDCTQIYKKMKEKILNPINDLEPLVQEPKSTDDCTQIYKKMKEKIEKDFKVTVENSNCDKCKYFKKLEELDNIIESLKNFEKKMILQEKFTPIQKSGCDKILKSIEKNKEQTCS